MSRKNVVIVDDSPVMRTLVRQKLEGDGRFSVVGEAGDPFEAREVIKRTNPDVLTLDVEMPRMNGLSFLEKVMRLRPLPVVMLSTETHKGSAAAVEALSLGAIDCIGKPRSGSQDTMDDLADRVFAASNARMIERKRAQTKPPPDYHWNGKIVVVGASTGGVDALERVFGDMPANCPPILVAQHMPTAFLESFAERLNSRIAPDVALAQDGEGIRQGQIRIAPGGDCHLKVTGAQRFPRTRLEAGAKVSGHRPSVDALFASATAIGPTVVAVILTGMGRDGADGMLALRGAGAYTIAQDQESSVVYGMPRVADEIGGAMRVLSLDRIATEIISSTSGS